MKIAIKLILVFKILIFYKYKIGSFKVNNKKSELHDILNTVYSKGGA